MNYRTTHAFNSLRDIVNTLQYRTKYASNGMNSSMPDDPSGDGFREPVTGPQFTEYTDDYSNTNPFTPNVGQGAEPSLTAENQQENSGSDFDIYVSGDGPDGQDECKTTKDDPGTSMPAEAGEEKYSAYMRYSMEENIDGFNKCAGLWLSMYNGELQKQAGQRVLDASEYPFTKQAIDSHLPQEVVEELAGLESLPLQMREKMAAMSNYELAQIINECDQLLEQQSFVKQAEADVLNNMSVSDYNKLASVDTQSLMKLAEDATEAADAMAEDEAQAEEPSLEEAEALDALSPEDVEILQDLEPEQLEALIQAAAEDSEDLGDAADAEEAVENNPEIAAEADAIESLPEETVDKLASLSPEMLQMYMNKLAEDAAAIAAMPDDVAAKLNPEDLEGEVAPADEAPEEGPDPEEEELQAILDELPPDVAEELVNMSPEELQEVIEEAQQVEDGGEGEDEDVVPEGEAPQLLEQMAGQNGSSEGEALNDLSSAMTEENVTPEELAEMGKQSSWQFQRELVKLAAAVKAYRDAGLYQYRRPRTTKEARARAQMHNFLNEIR